MMIHWKQRAHFAYQHLKKKTHLAVYFLVNPSIGGTLSIRITNGCIVHSCFWTLESDPSILLHLLLFLLLFLLLYHGKAYNLHIAIGIRANDLFEPWFQYNVYLKQTYTHTHTYKNNQRNQIQVKSCGKKAGDCYSFLSAFDCIIILINSVYYILTRYFLFLVYVLYVSTITNLNENTHTWAVLEPRP